MRDHRGGFGFESIVVGVEHPAERGQHSKPAEVTAGDHLPRDNFGLVIAWISFTNRAADDLHGQINWVKGPDAAAKYYPEGLAIAGDAVGSIFAPPSILALNLQVAKLQSAGTGNGRITSLTVSSTTGTFKGSLLQPTGASVTFQGALLQRPNAGYGFILGTNDSMPVLLSP